MTVPALEVQAVGFFTKWGAIIIAVLVVILLVVGWLGYNSWRNAQNGKAIVNAGHAINTANVNGGQAAVNTTAANQNKNEDTDAKLSPIINNYNTYPAAKQIIDPAFFRAFDLSLCVYRSAANLLQCRTMQQVNP